MNSPRGPGVVSGCSPSPGGSDPAQKRLARSFPRTMNNCRVTGAEASDRNLYPQAFQSCPQAGPKAFSHMLLPPQPTPPDTLFPSADFSPALSHYSTHLCPASGSAPWRSQNPGPGADLLGCEGHGHPEPSCPEPLSPSPFQLKAPVLTCALLADDHSQVDRSPVWAGGTTVRAVSVCPIGPDLLSHLVVRQGLGYCFLQSGRPALPSPPRLGCEAEGWTASPWAWTPSPLPAPPPGAFLQQPPQPYVGQPSSS